jgi:hypothetical protein
MKKVWTKDKVISSRLNDDIYYKLEEEACKKCMSLSNLVRIILTKYANKGGHDNDI